VPNCVSSRAKVSSTSKKSRSLASWLDPKEFGWIPPRSIRSPRGQLRNPCTTSACSSVSPTSTSGSSRTSANSRLPSPASFARIGSSNGQTKHNRRSMSCALCLLQPPFSGTSTPRYRLSSRPMLRISQLVLSSSKGTPRTEYSIRSPSTRKFNSVELNYEIYDKEMLAIVETMDQYRHYFEGLGHATTAFSDHRNLLWLTETKVYDRRQAWWAEKLSRFDFKIVFRPGKQGGKPDVLSERPDYTLGKVADERTMTFLKSSQINTSLLPTDDPVLAAIALSPAQIYDASILNEFSDSLRTALDEDNTIATILSHLRDPELPRSEELMETLAPFALDDRGFLLRHDLV